MEKAHGWTYNRIRNTNRESIPTDSLSIQTSGNEFLRPGTPYADSNVVSLTNDFRLYPGPDGHQVPRQYEDQFFPNFNRSEAYVPWKSPNTRMQKNEFFLQAFSQTYTHGPRVTDNRSSDDQWLNVIDPTLSSTVPTESNTFSGRSLGAQAATSMGQSLKALSTIIRTPAGSTFKPGALSPIPEQTSATTLSPMVKLEDAPSRWGQVTPTKAQPVTRTALSRNTEGNFRPAKRAVRFVDEDDDEADGDDEPPRKQQKKPLPADEDDFSDKDMPCPFRFSHPSIYDVENDQRYASCHTKHENISTVV